MLLLSMVLISSLIGLGTHISSNFGMIGDAMDQGTSSINRALGITSTSISTYNGSGTTSGSTFSGIDPAKLASNIVQNGVANGTTASSGTVSNTSQMIMVSGANGATDYLASTLTQRTEALLASGAITQEQANELYKLANAGHNLASAQTVLENALATGQTSITVNNQSYSLQEYAYQLGYKVSTSAVQNWQVNPGDANTFLEPFAQQYALVKQSPAMQDPQVGQQVSSLVMQIGALSDAINWSFCETCGTKPPTNLSDFSKLTATHFESNMQNAPISSVTQVASNGATSLTNTNSAGICKAGSGKDAGSSCTP